MDKSTESEVRSWINQERNFALDLPADFHKTSGNLTRSSRTRLLSGFIDPMFGCAGALTAVGPKFDSKSFSGEGKHLLRSAQKDGKCFRFSYEKNSVRNLGHFFFNQTGSASTDSRGALLFRLRTSDFLKKIPLKRLESPHFVRNYKVAFSRSAITRIRSEAAAKGTLVVALSDQVIFSPLFLFGSRAELKEVFDAWLSNF